MPETLGQRLSQPIAYNDSGAPTDPPGPETAPFGVDTDGPDFYYWDTATDAWVNLSNLTAAPTLVIAAGVPAGAPAAGKLPIAIDTTVMGKPDAYYWNGAAWVEFEVGAINFP